MSKHQSDFEIAFFEGILRKSPSHLEALTHQQKLEQGVHGEHEIQSHSEL